MSTQQDQTDLRLIAACAACGRQVDASGRAAGSQLHCSCGELITVPEAHPHEAAVVRCSACGAPRQSQAPTCSFCSSDFTIHEQDLDTLCPTCGARVSGKGRFCHFCATPILVEGAAGEATDRPCPACADSEGSNGQTLTSRRLGRLQLAVLECGRCGGLWLGEEAFKLLAERVRRGELSPRDHGIATGGELKLQPQADGRLYRPCPQCGKLMNRRNYGRSSGVILDLCKEHGVWFDVDELGRVLAWLKTGGRKLEAERRAEEQAEKERRERIARTMEEPGEGSWLGPTDRRSTGVDLFAALGGLVWDAVDFVSDWRR